MIYTLCKIRFIPVLHSSKKIGKHSGGEELDTDPNRKLAIIFIFVVSYNGSVSAFFYRVVYISHKATMIMLWIKAMGIIVSERAIFKSVIVSQLGAQKDFDGADDLKGQ